MTTIQKLQASLPNLKVGDFKKVDGEYVFFTKEVAPRSFIRDGYLNISLEEGDGAGDYYGRYIAEDVQDGIPYINPVLEAWAKANGGYFEWQNAGCIVFNV
jgi:hypothetical protein